MKKDFGISAKSFPKTLSHFSTFEKLCNLYSENLNAEVIIRKKVLFTGGRSLFTPDLARRFDEQGCDVFIAETSPHHVCRYSNSVSKNFIVPSPRFQPNGFADALVSICEQEGIDLVIPTFEEIFCLSTGLHRFPPSCTVFCENYETLDHLHNKWLFNQKLHALGLLAPQSYLIHSQEQLETIPLTVPYILKPSYSRAATRIVKVTTKTPPKVSVDPRNPLVAQQWIHGREFCSYSIAHKGKLAAHAAYPVDYTIDGSCCLNFKATEHPAIQEWVETFVQKENFTGQIAFDFIEPIQGNLYVIECNPRGTSGINLFQKENNLPSAFFNLQKECITPTPGYAKQMAVGMLFYGWKKKKFSLFIKKFLRCRDVIFSLRDLKPFFHNFILLFVYLFRSFKLGERFPAMFTFDIDWNGEADSYQDSLSCEELH